MMTKEEKIAALEKAVTVLEELEDDWDAPEVAEGTAAPEAPAGGELTEEQYGVYLAVLLNDAIADLEEVVEIIKEEDTEEEVA